MKNKENEKVQNLLEKEKLEESKFVEVSEIVIELE